MRGGCRCRGWRGRCCSRGGCGGGGCWSSCGRYCIWKRYRLGICFDREKEEHKDESLHEVELGEKEQLDNKSIVVTDGHIYYGVHMDDAFLSEINAQVDLEIALRHRLADTVQSRIAWALILQESLQKGMHLVVNFPMAHCILEGRKASQDFPPNDPLTTLSITESSSECILARDPRGPPSQYIRPPRKSNLPVTKTKSFLYIRSSALALGTQSRDDLYRLQCPECLRISFSSLQGLLNHARLAHNLEWGTHDECIRACAVPGNEKEVEGGVEVGLGPTGVLPALRTIFQMAVGAQENLQGGSIVIASNSQSPSMAPHLTQTLGLHEDSATLAPYLGKKALRREIRVWDEDKHVDIETLTQPDVQVNQKLKYRWKMPFTQRNSVSSESESNLELFGVGNQTSEVSAEPQPILGSSPRSTIPTNNSLKLPSNQSRFYFGTRIIVTDRSLWVPPGSWFG